MLDATGTPILCASLLCIFLNHPTFTAKQKTLLCLGKWTAHISVKRHIEPWSAGEHSEKEKLTSLTNAYLFPILTPSHNTLLLLSQHEALISLGPECMRMLSVDIFGEKQYVVLSRGCLSLLRFVYSVTGNHQGMESIPLPRCLFRSVPTDAHTPRPPKQSFEKWVLYMRCILR